MEYIVELDPNIPKRQRVVPLFSGLKDLHLEFIEVKKKLSPTAPVVVMKPVVSSKHKKDKIRYIEFDENDKKDKSDDEDDRKSDRTFKSHRSHRSHKSHRSHDSDDSDEDEKDNKRRKYDREHDDDDLDDKKSERSDHSDRVKARVKEESEDEKSEDEPEEVDQRSPEEIESEQRSIYTLKFKILRKKFKEREDELYIPEDHEDIKSIKNRYDTFMRTMAMENNISKWSKYVQGSWLATEVGFTQFLKIDMSGFTEYQMKSKDQYDLLLIELGEKNSSDYRSSIPVELRLLGLIIFQGLLFFVIKHISKQKGEHAQMLSMMIKGFFDTPTINSNSSVSEKIKDRSDERKMDNDVEEELKKEVKMKGPRRIVKN